jgi:hypothetical protein
LRPVRVNRNFNINNVSLEIFYNSILFVLREILTS